MITLTERAKRHLGKRASAYVEEHSSKPSRNSRCATCYVDRATEVTWVPHFASSHWPISSTTLPTKISAYSWSVIPDP